MPRGSKLGMSWSMDGARLKPLLNPLGMSNRGPEASGISGRAVDALCMNAERMPLPKLGADCRPAGSGHTVSAHSAEKLFSCQAKLTQSRWLADKQRNFRETPTDSPWALMGMDAEG